MNNLTKSQQKLADLLLDTKTHTKVRRRRFGQDDEVEFYYVERDTSPIDFRENEEEFAFVHHEQNPTAPLSPVKVNLRKMPDSLNMKIAECMAEMKLKQNPDLCTGIPNAAIPYAKDYAQITGIPYVTLFDKDDSPGSPRILAATDAPKGNGKTILIIDDVITKGASKFRAFKVAEELGYKVLGLVVLIDRDEGGKEMIEEAGYKFYAPLKLKDLLDYYLEKRMISEDLYTETVNYLKQSKRVD
ncbi:MAG TPA: phosphoribosyltransferase family protein [Patescibacteria group bacterium]|nr:phosphoribosyltransferase family protein [Patescibacteria group bacterium]